MCTPRSRRRENSSKITTPSWSSSFLRITTTGFFYKVMPSFCIGMRARGVGDYGTHLGPLNVPEDIAADCAKAVLGSGVDVAVSASMDVDHGTVQPLEKLFGDATARPVIPIFINAIAVPLGPLHRCRALGTAVGNYLATLDKRVLVIGSGGLSHSPPVPTLATAGPAVLQRIVHGEPMTSEQRQARQTAVIDAAKSFAGGRAANCNPLTRRGITTSWRSSTKVGWPSSIPGRTRSCYTKAAAPPMKSERG